MFIVFLMNTTTMTTDELLFARRDLAEVIDAQNSIVRTLGDNAAPKLGQYTDELFAVCAALQSRGVR